MAFNPSKMGPSSSFPNLIVQMLFSKFNRPLRPDLRKVGKSLQSYLEACSYIFSLSALGRDSNQSGWVPKLYLFVCFCDNLQGLFQQFWGKAPDQNWEKMINVTPKLGEINNIEHNKGSKIYPQNQVILDFLIVLCQAYHLTTSV